MAFVVDDSVASVPPAHLAQLRAELMLESQPNSQIATGERAALIAEAHDPCTHDGPFNVGGRAPVPAEVDDPLIATAASHSGADRLAASTSAMPAPLLAPPSQDAVAAATRTTSFHDYPGGDTQPMESQVYRDFNASMLRPNELVTPMKPSSGRAAAGAQTSPDALAAANGETCATTATDKTPRTCIEGETGYIDVLDGFQPSPLAQSQSPSSSTWAQDEPVDELWTEGTAQPNHDAFARPALPETPAAAGGKQGLDGEVLNSAATTAATKTPGYSQLFGGRGAGAKGDLLTATQLFNQTQAPSSPLLDVPHSDPVVSRPSPNAIHPFSISSPEMTFSSPVATMPARSSTNAEPRGTYTSVRESQEHHRQLRASRLRKDLGLHERFGRANDSDGDDDGYGNEFDGERRLSEQKRLKRTLSDQALGALARASVPSRLTPAGGNATIDLVTSPAIQTRGERVEFEFSEDGDRSDIEDEEMGAEDDEEGDVNVHGDGDGDDVYDELGQIVLRSQSHDFGAPANDDAFSDVVDEERIQGTDELNAPSRLAGRVFVTEDVSLAPDEDEPAVADVEGSQHMAVADSQPEQLDGAPPYRTPAHSSLVSFIPGSQYTGRTSQDQARHSKAKAARSLSQRGNGDEGVDRQPPSSPPVFGDGIHPTVPGPDASPLGEEVGRFGDDGTQEDAPVDEVPESDMAGPMPSNNGSGVFSAFETARHTASHSVPPFSTARTHVSSNDLQHPADPLSTTASPLKKLPSQQSKSASSQTPRRAAGVRHFSQIADSSPVGPPSLLFHPSADSQLDLDALVGDVLTTEDQAHLQAMSSPQREQPPPKRRSLARGRAVALWPETSGNPAAEPTSARGTRDAGRFDPGDNAAAKEVADANEVPDISASPTASKALRSSPNKANEMAAGAPPGKAVSEDGSESTRKREKTGANAASQLVAKRGNPAAKVPAKVYRGKKPPAVTAPAKSKATKAKVKQKAAAVSRVAAKSGAGGQSARMAKQSAVLTAAAHGSATEDAVLQSSERPEKQGESTIEGQPATLIETGDAGALPTATRPRVFAVFRGNNACFYPATWVRFNPDGRTQTVRFDDGVETSVEAHLVCMLDLRLNDIVKVDMAGMRKQSWIIKGFGEIEAGPGTTDAYGHRTINVQMKAARTSTAACAADAPAEGDVVEVAVEKIYLPPSMWEPFRARSSTPLSREGQDVSRAATPTSRIPSLNGDTPTSRSRRATLSSVRPLAGLPQLLREGSVTSSTTGVERKIFSNMAFAISYGGNDAEKAEVTRLILSHGGQILEKGFDELFDLPDLADTVEIGPQDLPDDVEAPTPGPSLLRLKPASESLGFVALIADRHSRREKYIQALALGLPTLSGRWIIDSLDPSKNTSARADDAAPLPWAKYLLPAGESSYLNGAVRSRTLDAFPSSPAHPPLAASLAARHQLLAAAGVLIVVPKKSRPAWERRRTFIFLALALGAGRVRRVADLADAQAALAGPSADDGRWQWLFTDGSLADARAALLPRGKAAAAAPVNGKSKKRKFGAETGPPRPARDPRAGEEAALSVSDGRVRVVNDEFVVQSLVLGDLVD